MSQREIINAELVQDCMKQDYMHKRIGPNKKTTDA